MIRERVRKKNKKKKIKQETKKSECLQTNGYTLVY